MSEGKLVSVIIPTYGRPSTLTRAIDSVLNQTYKNVEIIVVDDNNPNTDDRKNTECVIKKYIDLDNMIYIKHDRNKNGSAARNTGFRNSSGEFIMFLDDDDEFLPNKIHTQVDRLSSLDRSWGACYTNYIRKKSGKITVYGNEKREGNLLTEELMRNLFVHAGSNLMIRREVVSEVGGFDESFKRNQDVEFLSRILVKYKLAYADVIGLIVHVHDRAYEKEIYEEITLDYMNKFSHLVNQMPEKDRNRINKMIDLQLFRYFITTRGKRKKGFQKMFSKDLSLCLICRYMTHLLIRRISKKAYGFKM